jgi:hypothetical protein
MTGRIGLAGLALLVALTACALTAASASANVYFEPEVVKFTTKSGTSTLYVRGIPSIKCSSDKGTGGITSKEGLSWVSFIFEGCDFATHCGSSLGFEALPGELGTVAKSEATSELGVMLKINSTIECGTETLKIRGTVAGEFTPKTSTTSHNLNFEVVSGGEQKIKTIDLNSGPVKPKLEIAVDGPTFVAVALESDESNTFVKAIEVV